MTSHSNKDLKLPVSEQFLSMQGEGPNTGRPSYFLRLKSCNLLCGGIGTDKDGLLHDGATWRCDTVEVWLKGVEKTLEQISNDFGENFRRNILFGPHRLIITGGEPLLHQKNVGKFLEFINIWPEDRLGGSECFAEIETNGTITPNDKRFDNWVGQYNVSPKLSNSGMPIQKRLRPDTLNWFTNDTRTVWKFVVKDLYDVEEVMNTFILPYHLHPYTVWMMPAADNRKDLADISELIAKICIDYGFNFSNRLHVQIWDKKTGV
jgi:7-carboxy-7-deazaguanine synthase